MMSSAVTMRSGLPKSSSHGCSKPGIRRLETEKPTKPAFGFAPRPVAGDAFGEFAVEPRAGGEVELAARRFGDELFGEEALAAAGAAGDQNETVFHGWNTP